MHWQKQQEKTEELVEGWKCLPCFSAVTLATRREKKKVYKNKKSEKTPRQGEEKQAWQVFAQEIKV